MLINRSYADVTGSSEPDPISFGLWDRLCSDRWTNRIHFFFFISDSFPLLLWSQIWFMCENARIIIQDVSVSVSLTSALLPSTFAHEIQSSIKEETSLYHISFYRSEVYPTQAKLLGAFRRMDSLFSLLSIYDSISQNAQKSTWMETKL